MSTIRTLEGPKFGMCVGFWSPTYDSIFPDVMFIRKKPVRYLGIPILDCVREMFLHENTSSTSESLCQSTMSYQDVFSSRSNCILDFVCQLPFIPTYLIYCQKKSAEVIDNVWYCIYDSNPVIIEIDAIRLPDKPIPVDAPLDHKGKH